jgi:hypothetical protein
MFDPISHSDWVIGEVVRLNGPAYACPRLVLALLPDCKGMYSPHDLASLLVPQRLVPQLLVVAIGFAVAYMLSLLVPAIRAEVFSFRELPRQFALVKRPEKGDNLSL